MHLINDISLKLLQELNDTGEWEPRSEILVLGNPTGVIIDGAILEAAVRWQDKTLLLVTHDCPFEEALSILLLDKELNITDRALMGWIYSTGSFENLELIEPDMLRFDFFGGNPWEIHFLSKPKSRIPFISEPSGVSRPFGFTRQFIVRGNPQPMTKEDLARESAKWP